MSGFLLALVSAFWFGILTSISPCPLATNIAAISFVAQDVENPWKVLRMGLIYTLGRAFTYIVLGALIIYGILAGAGAADFLQHYIDSFLGPILVVLGLLLLGWIGENLALPGTGGGAKKAAALAGPLAPFVLGVLFALSFCPVSAGLFFGSLLSLGVKENSPFLVPAAFGLGTGLPVLAFALAVSAGTASVGSLFHKVKVFESWARPITGTIFILVGIYYSLAYSWGLA